MSEEIFGGEDEDKDIEIEQYRAMVKRMEVRAEKAESSLAAKDKEIARLEADLKTACEYQGLRCKVHAA